MTIKAELTDGSIIALDGPCEAGCITHTGPHWLHVDRIERWMNDVERFNTVSPVLIRRLAELEIKRLQEKRRHMQNAGIARLIRDDANADSD